MVFLEGTLSSQTHRDGKFERITELLNRIYTTVNGRREVLSSRFSNSPLWKEFDLWSGLFERFVDMSLKNQQNKSKSKLFGFLVNGVQKAIRAWEQTDTNLEEVNS